MRVASPKHNYLSENETLKNNLVEFLQRLTQSRLHFLSKINSQAMEKWGGIQDKRAVPAGHPGSVGECETIILYPWAVRWGKHCLKRQVLRSTDVLLCSGVCYTT